MNPSQISPRRAGSGTASSADAFHACFATSYAGIIAFMAVASEGSFAKGAERLGVGRSSICRSVQKLEAHLSTRLFSRTTRATQLTREGERFFESCSRGVGHIVEAVSDLMDLREGPPRGLVRISAPADFGRRVVAPLLCRFAEAYPDIAVDLVLDDRPADFVGGQIDVAFRHGRIEDSSIIARQLAPMQLVLCASPAYARKHKLPSSVDELDAHDCINLRRSTGCMAEWEFQVDGQTRRYLPSARLTFNDPDLVLDAVLDGRGIAQLAGYQIRPHLARGDLVMALGMQAPDDRGHYISYLCRQHLPSRIRVFVDFMTAQIRALDLNPTVGIGAHAAEAMPEKMAA